MIEIGLLVIWKLEFGYWDLEFWNPFGNENRLS